MKFKSSSLAMLILAWPLLLHAEDHTVLTPDTSVTLTPPAGVSLGTWLTQNYPDLTGYTYTPGLMWLDASEVQKQTQDKQALLQELSQWADRHPESAAQVEALKQRLSPLPVTGRQTLVVQDPWLMQAHRNLEPLTHAGDTFVAKGRPDRVRVIDSQAQLCDVQFVPTRWAIDYLQACGVSRHLDQVWLIQPDGQITHLAIGTWNAQTQEAPAPGAWLWVSSAVDPSPDLSARVAHLIATQGVAQQAEGVTLPLPLPLTSSTAPKNLPLLPNDWGITGLLQTPSARLPRAGQVSLSVNRVWPYTYVNLSMSPFDSVELGMRYTNITNQMYGPSIAGDQSYKDKSSEIKWRMLDETATRPAVAMGLRDPGGTGLFSGEYVVASKRWHDFDMSLGLGWGYLGARQNFANPMRLFGSRFGTRQTENTGSGGTAQTTPLFTGRTAPFGGVQWQTPLSDLVLKVELDGNNYQHEPMGNDVGGARSPINWGLAWQKGPLGFSLGFERGQRWLFGFSLSTDLTKMSRTKSSEPAAWPVNTPALLTPVPAVSQPVADALAAQTGWAVVGLRQEGDAWVIELDNAQGFSLPDRLDRGMAVVHQLAPEDIRSAHFVLMQHGVPISSRQIDRATWADARDAWHGQAAVHTSVALPAPAKPMPEPAASAASAALGRKPSGNIDLGYQQSLGGPDGYLYALNATAQGQKPLWQGAWAQGTVNARLMDNYDNYHYTAPSNLPRVRTYVREYLTSQRVTLSNAQVSQLNQWGDGIYSLAYAGALESMFAGVGAEVMWRPLSSQWALGADINRLSQRDFDQRLGLRDYQVTSGHLAAYWDTRWQGVEAKLLVGQYLAGDRGATLDMSRRFDNGARMGAWITKTNVPSAVFGEGSFDKGIYFSIPFDAFLTAWSTQTMKFVWQPLIRDGGARLNKTHQLWDLTNSRDAREWTR